MCRPRKHGLDSEIPLHHRMWREKAVPKSYSLNFCSLKVFFLFCCCFYIWELGGVVCFFNCVLKAARPQCCDPGHPYGGTKTPEHNKGFQGVSGANTRCSLHIDKAGLFVI